MRDRATEVGPRVPLDPCEDAVTERVRPGGLREEGLEVVLNDRVERGGGWSARAVRQARGGPVQPPGGPRWEPEESLRRGRHGGACIASPSGAMALRARPGSSVVTQAVTNPPASGGANWRQPAPNPGVSAPSGAHRRRSAPPEPPDKREVGSSSLPRPMVQHEAPLGLTRPGGASCNGRPHPGAGPCCRENLGRRLRIL